MEELKAYVSNIQRSSVHDGPGLRTVVFFLKCPLRCKWCQNPETLSGVPRLMFARQNCAVCGACIPVCPEQAISLDESCGIVTDMDKCRHCFACVDECYFDARKPSGKEYTVSTLFKELCKDEVVFETSGGGVTLSGGEPTQHIEFCGALLTLLKDAGIHTAMETCGFVPWEKLNTLIGKVDLFLYDIKTADAAASKQWTGVDSALILNNAQKLAAAGANMVIRVPLIPGVNDTDEAFGEIVAFCRRLPGVNEMHILPFHQVGAFKYDMLAAGYELADWEEESADAAQRCKELAECAGFKVSVGGTGFAQNSTIAR